MSDLILFNIYLIWFYVTIVLFLFKILIPFYLKSIYSLNKVSTSPDEKEIPSRLDHSNPIPKRWNSSNHLRTYLAQNWFIVFYTATENLNFEFLWFKFKCWIFKIFYKIREADLIPIAFQLSVFYLISLIFVIYVLIFMLNVIRLLQ